MIRKKSNPDIAIESQSRAQIRHDSVVRATAGNATVPAVTDSSNTAIAEVSPLSFEEREAAKRRLIQAD